MKIDWKEVSKSPGYRSLKAAYEFDIRKNWRSKEQTKKFFFKVIYALLKIANVRQLPLEQIINEYEEKRTYWWLNYYNDHKLKMDVVNIKGTSYKHMKPCTYYKNQNHYSPKDRREILLHERTQEAREKRKKLGKKARYTSAEKEQHRRHIKHRQYKSGNQKA